MSSIEPSGVLITYAGREQPARLLAVVADRRLSAAALAALLLQDPSYRITREAQGVGQVRAMLAAERPQVMVLDVSGTAFFALIDASTWGVRTLLLLDANEDTTLFADAVRARVQGYLSRSASRQTLEAAIARLCRSGSYLEAPTLPSPASGGGKENKRGREDDPAELSLREREILVWIASGRSTKEIARECAITPKTVGNHVNNMVQKLKFRHRGQLVLYAAQQGLTTI